MESIPEHDKRALDAYHEHGIDSLPWEIPTVIGLVLLTAFWLFMNHRRNQKLQAKGSELCRKSLGKTRR